MLYLFHYDAEVLFGNFYSNSSTFHAKITFWSGPIPNNLCIIAMGTQLNQGNKIKVKLNYDEFQPNLKYIAITADKFFYFIMHIYKQG